MEEQKQSFGARNVIGIILIIVGGLFLLKELDLIFLNIPRIIFSFPFILFIVGILILANSQKKVFGAILMGIGAFFLIPRLFPFVTIEGKIIFPVIIIALGIYIIFKHRSAQSSGYVKGSPINKDVIDDIAIFGGGEKIIHSDNFKGGNITAIFGGSEIDLTNCKLAEGNQVIDVLCLFGGTEINVPKDWNVILSITPIFGGFSHKIKRDPNILIDKERTLIIKGLVIFGGGDVQSKY